MSISKKDEEKIREIVREELTKAFLPGGLASMGIMSAVATSTALATRNAPPPPPPSEAPVRPGSKPFERNNSSIAVDNVSDQLEVEAMGAVAVGFEKRVEAGMTKDQALVMAQIEEGFDLTPEGYKIDPSGSYFASFRPSGEAFKKAFVSKVQGGKTREVAYEETCGEFGCNINKREGAFRRIHEEIASGQFSGLRLKEAQDHLRKSSDKLLQDGLGSLGGNVKIDDT